MSLPADELPIADILSGQTQALMQSLRILSRELPAADFSGVGQARQKLGLKDLEQLIESDHWQPAKSLLKGLLQAHKLEASQVSLELRAPLWLADQYVSLIRQQLQVHREIAASCLPLFLRLIYIYTQRPDLLQDNQHPLQQLMDTVYQQVLIWEPSSGRAGRAITEKLDEILCQLKTIDINKVSELEQMNQRFQAFSKQQTERAKKFEQRLLDSSHKNDNVEAVRTQIMQDINRRLSDKPLPSYLQTFIRLTLINDMQYLLLHKDPNHPCWRKWLRLIQVCSWAFVSDGSNQSKKQTLLPPLLEQLNNEYWQDIEKHESYEETLELLQRDFMLILHGQTIETEPFSPFDVEMTRQQPLKVDNQLIEQAVSDDLNDYTVGDWFLFHLAPKNNANNQANVEARRCKLLAKDSDSILFVNYLGQKVTEKTPAEFSLALASHVAQPLTKQHVRHAAWRGALKAMANYHNQLHASGKEKAEREAIAKAATKAKRESAALLRQKEARKQQQTQTQLQQQALAASSAEQIQHYQQLITGLQVGAWVSFSHPSNANEQRHKLSVKLVESDKYIFTNRHGQKTGDYNLEQLVGLVASQQLKILKQGESFDNSLEKVVRGLRKS